MTSGESERSRSQVEFENAPLVRFFSEIIRVKDDPRLLILVAHGVLELFVNALVDARCKNGKRITSDSRGYPHSTRLIILHEVGVLSDAELKRLDWFRKLRNRAAHEPLFTITAEDLANLPDRYRDPSMLYELCVHVVGGLWNKHIPVLMPLFSPSIAVGATGNDT